MPRYRLAVASAFVVILVLTLDAPLEGRSGVPGSASENVNTPAAAPVSRESTMSAEQANESLEQVEDLDALLPACAPLDLSTATDQHPAPLDAPVANCDHRELDLGPAPIKKQAHPVPSGVELTDQP